VYIDRVPLDGSALTHLRLPPSGLQFAFYRSLY
jgi:hypothetical protein